MRYKRDCKIRDLCVWGGKTALDRAAVKTGTFRSFISVIMRYISTARINSPQSVGRNVIAFFDVPSDSIQYQA